MTKSLGQKIHFKKLSPHHYLQLLFSFFSHPPLSVCNLLCRSQCRSFTKTNVKWKIKFLFFHYKEINATNIVKHFRFFSILLIINYKIPIINVPMLLVYSSDSLLNHVLCNTYNNAHYTYITICNVKDVSLKILT